jgi:peptidoglycan/LPS O-acetylase OafA/YrhL
MPVAWAYLGALLLYNWITQTHFVLLAEVRSCLLLYRNFFSPGTSGPTAHFWSLSLEEQFYLVWPFLLFVAGPGACRVVAAAGAVACAFYRWANFAHYDNYLFNAQTQVRADALLVGCLLALLWDREDIRGFVARWSKLWAVPGMIVGVCIVRYNFLPPLYESVCFALLIAVVLLPEPNRLSAFASSRTLVYLGTISYSVYVWQELFMFRAAGGSSSILLLGIGLPSCVLLSYYLIERPCRRFGRRLTV